MLKVVGDLKVSLPLMCTVCVCEYLWMDLFSHLMNSVPSLLKRVEL